ncbi:hypothetical protein OkiPb00454_05490 [Escherichia coli]
MKIKKKKRAEDVARKCQRCAERSGNRAQRSPNQWIANPCQWSHQTDFDAVNGTVINFRAVGPRLFHGGSDADDRATYGWRGIEEHQVSPERRNLILF